MRQREKILAVLALLLLIGAVKVGQQVYRWYAFAAERAQIGAMETKLHEAGLGVIATQVGADSLRRRIEAIDDELVELRAILDRYERQVLTRPPTASVASTYRRELERYNGRVGERNELFRRWSDVVDQNHRDVNRYNSLADSVRGIAAQIGEPYYPILSPAEIADRHGLLDTVSAPLQVERGL